MPYHIGKKGSHGCGGFPVVNSETGKVMSCNATEEKAKNHLAALYIHVEDANKAADGFTPPKTVQQNAARGLELRREFGRGGTEVGVARARDLSNGKSLPLETINRMVSYFARHEVDKKGENWGNASNPSKGYIAWLLWGGDAGKAWANSIAEREKKKEKSMALDITSAFAQIIKQEKLDDGTLLVYGKATDDSVDIDQQICDAAWLEKAMPEWFKTGGNIREQHSNIAAGVAKELNSTNDGHYISALVVDPVSVKKVETGVLKGFSIGIRAPRVVRDNKAANGRIIDGQIVEVSLVDRPANPNAKLMLAKSDNANNLVQVEELIEAETVKGENMEHEEDKAVSEKPSKEEMLKRYAEAKKALDEIKAECKEAGIEIEIDEDEEEVEEKRQYGESAEEETEEGSEAGAAEEEVEEAEGKKPVPHKSADTEKCLECGCNKPADSHGKTIVEVTGGVPNGTTANVSTATMVSPTQTPKSTDTVLPRIDVNGNDVADHGLEDEHDVFDDEDLSEKTITAIIEKAVKSATETVTNEINAYKEEINKLNGELATAKSKAVAGGPKRTALKADVETYSEFLVKAVEYRAKAAQTSDKKLAQGYKELAQDFEAKALAIKPTDK
jgi:pSer/pThr/pTyr-binding forkhead associated (FHA) protein